MSRFESLYKTIAALIQLDQRDKDIIARLFREVKLAKGEYFLREGEICQQLGFVTEGILRYYIDKEGEERTYNFAQENQFVCNYESLIRQSPSPKHIQAIEPVRLLVISSADLPDFYQEVTEGHKFGRLHMEATYAETVRQLVAQYTETSEERYLKFLTNHPDLQQRIPQYYIASYVGVKPPSLSRIRKRLSESEVRK